MEAGDDGADYSQLPSFDFETEQDFNNFWLPIIGRRGRTVDKFTGQGQRQEDLNNLVRDFVDDHLMVGPRGGSVGSLKIRDTSTRRVFTACQEDEELRPQARIIRDRKDEKHRRGEESSPCTPPGQQLYDDMFLDDIAAHMRRIQVLRRAKDAREDRQTRAR